MKIHNIFNKKSTGKNFYDLPSREKKKLIKDAVRGSNELQEKLAKEFAY